MCTLRWSQVLKRLECISHQVLLIFSWLGMKNSSNFAQNLQYVSYPLELDKQGKVTSYFLYSVQGVSKSLHSLNFMWSIWKALPTVIFVLQVSRNLRGDVGLGPYCSDKHICVYYPFHEKDRQSHAFTNQRVKEKINGNMNCITSVLIM